MNFRLFIIFASIIFLTSSTQADESTVDLSFYTGTFDVIDDEGDDKTSLFGIEHKNPDLFNQAYLFE